MVYFTTMKSFSCNLLVVYNYCMILIKKNLGHITIRLTFNQEVAGSNPDFDTYHPNWDLKPSTTILGYTPLIFPLYMSRLPIMTILLITSAFDTVLLRNLGQSAQTLQHYVLGPRYFEATQWPFLLSGSPRLRTYQNRVYLTSDAIVMRESPAHADSHPQRNKILSYSVAKTSELTVTFDIIW